MLYKQDFFIILLIKDKAQRQQTRRRSLTGRLLRGRYCIINFAKNQVKKLFLPPFIDLFNGSQQVLCQSLTDMKYTCYGLVFQYKIYWH
jgi:hypothetical protein